MAAQVFHDRRDAGRQLAHRLTALGDERPVVVALPRGGVPVGFEVARALNAPLDILVVRKVGAPGHAELGIGAVAEGGVRVFNNDILRSLQVSVEELEHATRRAERELDERLGRYRADRSPLNLAGRTVILVDDGLATGGTARVAAHALRERGPARLVLAIPVGAPDSIESLRDEFDEIVCLEAPDPMWAIGHWYEHFEQTSDDEVTRLLEEITRPRSAVSPPKAPTAAPEPPRRERVLIPLRGGGHIAGDLVLPQDSASLVLFAHGSGSSRHSPRNRQVAGALNHHGHATLLIDLLTLREERHRENVFDIALLAERLVAATGWVRARPDISALGLGFFGASTGAGAALWAAAELGESVQAVVSRGGRPDLATARLTAVRAPTLLIVGGDDEIVLELNRHALARLRCEAELQIVPGATHLFEEPGTLEAVQDLAATWFTRHLVPAPVGGR